MREEANSIAPEHVRLVPLDPDRDAALAVAWYGDPEVLSGSEGTGTAAYDLATVDRMYRYLASIGEAYLIQVEEDGALVPVGDCALARDTLPIVVGDARYRGRGVGRTVLGRLVDRAKKLGWRELRVRKIYGYNARAMRLYEGAGFRLRETGFDGHGRPTASYTLRLR